jgi:SAM-dependent methyltransferase
VKNENENENEQSALWNGPGGRAWVESQDLLDVVLRPFEELLLESTRSVVSGQVLDVGCGAGSTTLAFARRLGHRGRALGVDVSEPMLQAARARSERAKEPSPPSFVLADAQRHAFTPESFDLVASRFGVMFFDDPVAAFANLRRAAKPGAVLCFIAWRTAAENAFMTTAERAAAPLLPNLPPRRPDGPGQFGFGDRARVDGILRESGWQQIDIQPADVACEMPAADLDRYITRLGPVGRVLGEADEATRARVLPVLRTAFEPFVDGDVVRFSGASWVVGARA